MLLQTIPYCVSYIDYTSRPNKMWKEPAGAWEHTCYASSSFFMFKKKKKRRVRETTKKIVISRAFGRDFILFYFCSLFNRVTKKKETIGAYRSPLFLSLREILSSPDFVFRQNLRLLFFLVIINSTWMATMDLACSWTMNWKDPPKNGLWLAEGSATPPPPLERTRRRPTAAAAASESSSM